MTANRQTSYVSFNPSYWNLRKTDGQNAFSFIPHIGIYTRQADGQTTFHLTPHIGIQVRQTDGKKYVSFTSTVQSKRDRLGNRFILPLILESTHHKQRDNLRYISSFILESTPDRPTFHASYRRFRQTDGQTMFRFTFILRSKYDRRMDFYNLSYCNLRYRDRRTN